MCQEQLNNPHFDDNDAEQKKNGDTKREISHFRNISNLQIK